MSNFGKVAGPVLNISKCEAMKIGKIGNTGVERNVFGIKWKDNIRCLGIFVGHNTEVNHNKNWVSKVENIQSCLDKWSSRDLTLFGKTYVIKSLALPQIILSATLLAVPPQIIDDLNKIFFAFLWGKVERIKRIKLMQKTSDGGLNMINIQSYV